MAIVQNVGAGAALDVAYGSVNRVIANVSTIMALTPMYPGEIVLAGDTGVRYRALGLTAQQGWGVVTDRMN